MTIKVDTIRHHSASVDALTFDSSGNTASGKLTITHDDWDGLRVVNTNTDTYGAYIDLVKDSSSMADDDQSGVIRFRGDDDAGNEHTYGYILCKILDVSNGAEDGHIEFHTSYAGSVGERLRITRTGNIKVLDGDLQFATSGHGIDFSTGAGGSSYGNHLNEYEEGTWTPTWTGVTNNSSYNSWKYIKIGRMVMIWGTLIPSATTNDTTEVKSDLPFTQAANHTNGLAQSVGSISTHFVNWNKDGIIPIIQAGVGMRIQEIKDNAGLNYMASSEVSVNDQLMITVTYEAAT